MSDVLDGAILGIYRRTTSEEFTLHGVYFYVGTSDDLARLGLADLSAVIRARAPREPRGRGLALDVTFAIPGGQMRQLAFGYMASEPDSDPGLLARAFRGEVAAELERTAALWLRRLDAVAEPVAAYRSAARAGDSPA